MLQRTGGVALALCLFFLASFAVPGPQAIAHHNGNHGHEITIGFTYSGSGPYAAGSRGMRDGLTLWRDDTNAQGGIDIGGVRYTVTFTTYDDASDPGRVESLYRRLILEDQVDFLVAPYSSSLGSVAAAVAHEHGKLILTSVVASDEVYHRGYTTVHQVLAPGSAYLEHTVSALAHLQPGARVALLYKDDPFSRSVIDGGRPFLAAYGLPIVYDKAYPDTTTDFSGFVKEVAAAQPEAFIGGGHFPDGVALAEEIAAQGLPLAYLAIMSAPADHAFAELGEAAYGVVYPSLWEPEVPYEPTHGPAPQAFAAAYQERYGYTPDYHGAGGYSVGLTLQHALETAGSLDPEAVHAALDQTDILTLSGRVKFSTDPASHGLQTGHRVLLVQWQQGPGGQLRKEIVGPAEAKTAQIIFPKP